MEGAATLPTTACHQDGSAVRCRCNGTHCTCASCIPRPTNFFANICARNAADIASRKKITLRKWENAAEHSAALATSGACRRSDWQVLPAAVRPALRDRHPPHPGLQETGAPHCGVRHGRTPHQRLLPVKNPRTVDSFLIYKRSSTGTYGAAICNCVGNNDKLC